MNSWIIRITIFCMLMGISAAVTVGLWGIANTLPAGMSVSGWKIGGMTVEKFDKEFGQRVHALEATNVKLRAQVAGDSAIERSSALRDLGLQMNAGAIRAEIALMKEGSIWERAVRRWNWRNSELTLRIGLNERAFLSAMTAMWPEIYGTQPVNARRVIAANDTIKYLPGRSAVRIDSATLRKALAGKLGLPPNGKPESFPAPELFRPDGVLSPQAAPIVLDVPLFELQPKITEKSLRAEGIERLIAQFSTSFASSSEGRKHNVLSAARVINDMVLPPGAVFDYSKVIAETKQRFGFCEAPVIQNGKLVPGIGGGICQVSTTVYNAVLRAGLEIVERRNHSLPINYAPIGQDATYSTGFINFKWRNSSGKHLLIRTLSDNGVLTVKLFGSLPKNVSYEIKSVKVKAIKPPVKFVKNPSLAKGTVTLLQKGKPGYVVVTYRYKKVDGQVVSTEKISRDTYKPRPTLYASNVSGSDESSPEHGPKPPEEDIVEDGVSSE